MLRTRGEIKTLAANLVTMSIARLFEDFPRLKAVIVKIPDEEWESALDCLAGEIEQVLLNKFDSKD